MSERSALQFAGDVGNGVRIIPMQPSENLNSQADLLKQPAQTEPLKHSNARRADIDILRAVAVLSVILFHFDVKWMSGGFLGVDIFFVISGYLITLHLRQQLQEGTFSFVNFYARRIRRLLPALAATLAFTSVLALFILPVALLKEYALSAVTSSAYVSNIYFWSIADYFDTASIYKPLLHTWSLSVEEQFYIFWPLFIMVFLRRRLGVAIALAGVLSVFAGLFLNVSATTIFYQFPFRVHEFAVGALVTGISTARLPRWSKSVIVLIASAALGFGLLTTTEFSAFPGWGSLAVVIGTALIIAAAHPLFNVRSKLLQPVLRIGLTSYSAYLVHWPLVVFYKIMYPGDLQVYQIVLLLLATLYLGELFYQVIEQPTSRIRLPKFRFAVIAMAPAILACAVAFNLFYPKFSVLVPGREPQGTVGYNLKDMLDNLPDRAAKMEKARQLIAEKTTGKLAKDRKTIVVLGDSHAEDVTLALRLNLGDDNANVVLIHSDCDPLTIESITVSMDELYKNHYQSRTREEGYCYPFHVDLLSKIKEASPDLIVFSEAWRADALPFVRGTIESIHAVTPAKVLVLGRNPQFIGTPDVIYRDLDSVEAMNRSAWSRRDKEFDGFDEKLEEVAVQVGAYFISKNDIVCPDKVCDIGLGPDIGYMDAHHWTVAGLEVYGSRLVNSPTFKGLLPEVLQSVQGVDDISGASASIVWSWSKPQLDGWQPGSPRPTIWWPAKGGVGVTASDTSDNSGAYLRSPSLSLNGRDFDTVAVDLECVERCVADPLKLDLSLYYVTDSHGEDPMFRDKPDDFSPLATGERRRLVYHMSTPAVGGSDWVDSTIRQIRFDMPHGAAASYVVHSIVICKTGDPACN